MTPEEYGELKGRKVMKKTKVIFRKYKEEKEIIAIFPDLNYPEYCYAPPNCLSYMQIGQHSECDYLRVIEKTVSASKKEYADLYQELTDIGYNLEVIKKT